MTKKERVALVNDIVQGNYGDSPCLKCSHASVCRGCLADRQFRIKVDDLESKLGTVATSEAFELLHLKKEIDVLQRRYKLAYDTLLERL